MSERENQPVTEAPDPPLAVLFDAGHVFPLLMAATREGVIA